MSVIRIIVLHPYIKFEVRTPSRCKDMAIFGHGVNRPGDLDLSSSKWGHGSVVSYGLPFCQLLASNALPFSTYSLGSDTAQTDGRIDNGHQ